MKELLNKWVFRREESHPFYPSQSKIQKVGVIWSDIHVLFQPGYYCGGMGPVVDGPGGFLPEKPADLRAAGSVMNGPIIAGTNEEDGSLFVPICE